ncbi:hypothetical protein BZA05DRAFT_414783 [Tricharina praecox]|uniref:uncharacterized protein n=1 Tax=Tricharina praecox TaxID=43433 RepID=UPI00221F2640|nr:uncharacterized protein BZA05DRAFT_414783 [Tricharina praecox]KAI5859046.1 hypothetical protein BZA05DRAFT_414783 [Tricharina praecox]
MVSGAAKIATWIIRLLQFFFAVILMGITSYMVDQYRDGGFRVLREVSLPLAASVIALILTMLSMAAIFFLNHTLQLVAAFLDFVVFVLYLASAILLRHNYHGDRRRNPLWWSLMDVRRAQLEGDHPDLMSGLVKLLVAGVIIQLFLFFATTVLGILAATRSDSNRTRRSRGTVV